MKIIKLEVGDEAICNSCKIKINHETGRGIVGYKHYCLKCLQRRIK